MYLPASSSVAAVRFCFRRVDCFDLASASASASASTSTAASVELSVVSGFGLLSIYFGLPFVLH